METKTNIFFHAPKELTTDAFLVWLIYFLDSKEEYKDHKQTFFDNLILKKEDCGRKVKDCDLRRQENNVDVLLSFRFEDNGEKQLVLFENKTRSMQHGNQLAEYREKYPNCYRYFYYKLAYINSQEESEIAKEKYEVINASMMSSTIEDMINLHPLIKMYHEYINYTFEQHISSFHDKLFVNHDYNILQSADAQKYLCDIITEKMNEQNVPYIEIRNGTSVGIPWTQIDIAKTDRNGYSEKLFWRVDIRSKKYYIRLNQYAKPSNDYINYKKKRLQFLRDEANRIVEEFPNLKKGNLHNRKALYESEILIFFFEDNDLEILLNAIPTISQCMIDFFPTLN